MKPWRRLGRALPYLSALGIVFLSALLIGAIFLTNAGLPWQAFLGGALMAATLAFASRASNTAWTIARRTAQLEAARGKLASEAVLRSRAEKSVESVNTVVHYLDELMPAMIAYIDPEYRVQFHNRAYAHWLSKGNTRFEGRSLAEIFGRGLFDGMKPNIDAALAGTLMSFERLQKMPDGEVCRVAAQYVPHHGEDGKVRGVFAILADITTKDDVASEAVAMPPSHEALADGQALYADTLATELTQWHDVAERLAAAIKNDEFIVYAQRISPLAPDKVPLDFREILLRLQEEEDNLIPPGAFIPLAEKHGLMPDIDRWVVEHLVEWALSNPARRAATYSINLSTESLRDPRFVEFAQAQLAKCRAAGPGLCFELSEHEAMHALPATAAFMRDLKPSGCSFALSGFGRSPASVGLLRRLPVDYVKIDSGLILGMARNAVDAAKVKAITRVASGLGIGTIAECVEDEATVGALRALGVDYAQGFAVSRPAPLAQATAGGDGISAVLREPAGPAQPRALTT